VATAPESDEVGVYENENQNDKNGTCEEFSYILGHKHFMKK
jgi:hypothetical protein